MSDSKYVDAGMYVSTGEMSIDFEGLSKVIFEKEGYTQDQLKNAEMLTQIFTGFLNNEYMKKVSPDFVSIKFNDIAWGEILKTITIEGHMSEILTETNLEWLVFKIHR